MNTEIQNLGGSEATLGDATAADPRHSPLTQTHRVCNTPSEPCRELWTQGGGGVLACRHRLTNGDERAALVLGVGGERGCL